MVAFRLPAASFNFVSIHDFLSTEDDVSHRDYREQFDPDDRGACARGHVEPIKRLEGPARFTGEQTRLQILEVDVRNPPGGFFESNRRQQWKHQCARQYPEHDRA